MSATQLLEKTADFSRRLFSQASHLVTVILSVCQSHHVNKSVSELVRSNYRHEMIEKVTFGIECQLFVRVTHTIMTHVIALTNG